MGIRVFAKICKNNVASSIFYPRTEVKRDFSSIEALYNLTLLLAENATMKRLDLETALRQCFEQSQFNLPKVCGFVSDWKRETNG